MTKFSSQYGKTPQKGSSPIKSTTTTTVNHGGAGAWERDQKSDLFLLGVSNFVSEDTFYESAGDRDARFKELVHAVTREDADWVARFIPWLRNEANMRSASVVAAVEYGRAGGPDRRAVVASACSRPDEPAEVLSYWIGNYGKTIPSWLKRGVADASKRLYNEFAVSKYDGNSKDMRFADVIQLAHVKPNDDRQSALFKYALDARYGNDTDVADLPLLSMRKQITTGELTRETLLNRPDLIKSGGVTWEFLSGLGPMDARAWEAMIPSMGYMALLRNLRNFEQAGISQEAAQRVVARLSDPEQVARSRQLPFRFWSAYKNVSSLQWAWPLEQALGHSLKNIPSYTGRTLIVTDTSGSMEQTMSGRGSMSYLESAAVFASALALKGEDVDFYSFADGVLKVDLSRGGSVLKTVEKIRADVGKVGHGTNLPGALAQWDGHDRVIIFSDMQTLGVYGSRTGLARSYRNAWGYQANVTTEPPKSSEIPPHVPMYAFNLAGYAGSQMDPSKNEYEFGGLTDHTFKLLPILEKRQAGSWPF